MEHSDIGGVEEGVGSFEGLSVAPAVKNAFVARGLFSFLSQNRSVRKYLNQPQVITIVKDIRANPELLDFHYRSSPAIRKIVHTLARDLLQTETVTVRLPDSVGIDIPEGYGLSVSESDSEKSGSISGSRSLGSSHSSDILSHSPSHSYSYPTAISNANPSASISSSASPSTSASYSSPIPSAVPDDESSGDGEVDMGPQIAYYGEEGDIYGDIALSSLAPGGGAGDDEAPETASEKPVGQSHVVVSSPPEVNPWGPLVQSKVDEVTELLSSSLRDSDSAKSTSNTATADSTAFPSLAQSMSASPLPSTRAPSKSPPSSFSFPPLSTASSSTVSSSSSRHPLSFESSIVVDVGDIVQPGGAGGRRVSGTKGKKKERNAKTSAEKFPLPPPVSPPLKASSEFEFESDGSTSSDSLADGYSYPSPVSPSSSTTTAATTTSTISRRQRKILRGEKFAPKKPGITINRYPLSPPTHKSPKPPPIPSKREISLYLRAAKEGDLSPLVKGISYYGLLAIATGDDLGYTVLHYLAQKNAARLIEKVLAFARKQDLVVDIDCTTLVGYTPLMVAVQEGHYKTVRLLLSLGADHTILDRDNACALDYALTASLEGIIELLLDATIPHRSGSTQSRPGSTAATTSSSLSGQNETPSPSSSLPPHSTSSPLSKSSTLFPSAVVPSSIAPSSSSPAPSSSTLSPGHSITPTPGGGGHLSQSMERSAYQDTISSLQEELSVMRGKLSQMEDQLLCIICQDRTANALFFDCYHIVTCIQCSSHITHQCPICQQRITKTIRTYRL